MNQPATEQAAKKERKSAYYLVQAPQEFKTKKAVEEHLQKNGGIKTGETLLRGAPVVAEQRSVFKLA